MRLYELKTIIDLLDEYMDARARAINPIKIEITKNNLERYLVEILKIEENED